MTRNLFPRPCFSSANFDVSGDQFISAYGKKPTRGFNDLFIFESHIVDCLFGYVAVHVDSNDTYHTSCLLPTG